MSWQQMIAWVMAAVLLGIWVGKEHGERERSVGATVAAALTSSSAVDIGSSAEVMTLSDVGPSEEREAERERLLTYWRQQLLSSVAVRTRRIGQRPNLVHDQSNPRQTECNPVLKRPAPRSADRRQPLLPQ